MKGKVAWSPIGYEGPEQSLSAIWISPTQSMPLDCDLHRAMVGDRIDRIIAQFDEPEGAVAEMVDFLYASGFWSDLATIPVAKAGSMLVWNNPGVWHCFGAWGITEALPVFEVFDMPIVREALEYEVTDPWTALEGWMSSLVSWSCRQSPTAEEEASQLVHLKLCGHPSYR